MVAAVDITRLSAPRLDEVLKRVQRAMADGAVGPTRAAAMIVDLVERWDEFGYREQAGCDGRHWVNDKLGNRQAVRRAYLLRDAVEKLAGAGFDRDTTCMTRLHHQVLIYLAGESVPDDKRRAAVQKVLSEQRSKGDGVLFTLDQAMPHISACLGRKRSTRVDDRAAVLMAHIEVLNAMLRDAGREPPPVP